MSAEKESLPLEPQNFSISIHAWMQQAQATHGIGHDDHAEYHGYCSRKLQRVRHHGHVKKDLIHNSKYAASVSTRGRPRHAYAPRDDTDALEIVPHEEFLWVWLVQSERAWAHGMQLKHSGKRQHSLRRLGKAVTYAKKLEALAVKNCDASTVTECQAYAAWMQASWALEKGRYKVSV